MVSMSGTTIVENAHELFADPQRMLEDLTNELGVLHSDLTKLVDKKNTTAGTRVRKTLMKLKKFADAGRKITQGEIVKIKKLRKDKRTEAAETVDASPVAPEPVVQEPVAPEPVVAKKAKKSRKKKSKH